MRLSPLCLLGIHCDHYPTEEERKKDPEAWQASWIWRHGRFSREKVSLLVECCRCGRRDFAYGSF